MDPLHYRIIRALSLCTFLPGSHEKRFVRDIEGLGAYDMLSLKQAAYLEALAYKYRRQIGAVLVPPPPKKPSAEELRKLAAWNALGKNDENNHSSRVPHAHEAKQIRQQED